MTVWSCRAKKDAELLRLSRLKKSNAIELIGILASLMQNRLNTMQHESRTNAFPRQNGCRREGAKRPTAKEVGRATEEGGGQWQNYVTWR